MRKFYLYRGSDWKKKTIDPRGRPQSRPRPVVITIFTQSVCPSIRPCVRPKTSNSSDNHCRLGLWAGRVDHWWLLSCIFWIWRTVSYIEFPIHWQNPRRRKLVVNNEPSFVDEIVKVACHSEFKKANIFVYRVNKHFIDTPYLSSMDGH